MAKAAISVCWAYASRTIRAARRRADRLRSELGEGFEAIEIDSIPGNRWGFSKTAHSVLTEELVDEDGLPTRQALDRVLSFFDERLC